MVLCLFCFLFPSSNTKQQGSCYLPRHNIIGEWIKEGSCYRTHADFQTFQTDHPAHLAPYILYIRYSLVKSPGSEVAASNNVRKRKSGGDIPPLIINIAQWQHVRRIYSSRQLSFSSLSVEIDQIKLPCHGVRCLRFERVSGESPDFARGLRTIGRIVPQNGP